MIVKNSRIRGRGADDTEHRHGSDRLPAGNVTRSLRDSERQRRERSHRRRPERNHLRPRVDKEPPCEQAAAGIAARHPDDRERSEDLPLGLRTDEQRNADEAECNSRRAAGPSPADRGRIQTRAGR